ncbi:MAG TPA: TetR/AcrR family transcriptional regulator [Thermoleophilaceae bacterium]|jgi:AcrR family transcriptional regulator
MRPAAPAVPAAPTRFSRLEPDARRQAILDAARRVFLRSNPAAASTTEVAREAGVTRGLVHHYFGTKRALYLAVVADLAATLPSLVRTDVAGLPVDQMVDANVTSWLDSIERDRDLWLALLGVEVVGRDPEIESIMSDARDAVIDRMAGNQARDAEPTPELRLVLRIFLGAAEAAAREWALHGRASREQVHAALKGTLLAMVGQVLPAVPAGE